MSGGATAVMAAAAVAGAAISYQNGRQQAEANSRAMAQAEANAKKQQRQAEQEMNRANQKGPDTSALLSAAQQSGRGGPSGTMLTGPAGIDPSALSLGKSTLLGQ